MDVIIAVHDAKLRYAISVLAQEQPGWHVTGSVESLSELNKVLKLVSPEMIIIDVDLPGFDPKLIELDFDSFGNRIIYLVPTPINQIPAGYRNSPSRVWISKLESPESLVEIFRHFSK